jgi:hypothetical protein
MIKFPRKRAKVSFFWGNERVSIKNGTRNDNLLEQTTKPRHKILGKTPKMLKDIDKVEKQNYNICDQYLGKTFEKM